MNEIFSCHSGSMAELAPHYITFRREIERPTRTLVSAATARKELFRGNDPETNGGVSAQWISSIVPKVDIYVKYFYKNIASIKML
jgi:hypothetical protein